MSERARVTGFVTHGDCLVHRAGLGHPDRPERLTAVTERVRAEGLLDELDAVEATPADRADLELCHAPGLVDRIEAASAAGGAQLDPDTRAGVGSDRAARLATGAAVLAAENVMSGRWRNAFVATRPPGHHAEHDRAMGFCLYNHVAVAARRMIREHGLERIAILDWDVHHGNGTQQLFELDSRVFYASVHQFPHFPGSGSASERGRGDGEGFTLNCPMPAGSGPTEWLERMEGTVLPALEAFAPEVVIVSAGFDGHRDDPLGGCRLDEDTFRRFTRLALELADRTAAGRLVSVLEGGYDLGSLARSTCVHLEELVAHPCA